MCNMSLIINVLLPLSTKSQNITTARNCYQLVQVFPLAARRCFISQSSASNSCFIRARRRCIPLAHSSVILVNGIDIRCHRRMSMWTISNPSPHKKETLPDIWKVSELNFHLKSVVCVDKTDPRCLNNQKYEISSRSSDDEAEENMIADMHKRIVYKDDNIIAVNKPYGISVFGNGSSANQFDKSDRSREDSNRKISIARILPQLRKKMNHLELDIGLSLKSFYSGLVLLCAHKESMNKLHKVISGSHAQTTQLMTYLAITVGLPQCQFGVDLTANIKRERLHNREMSTVSDTMCRNACKKGSMIQTNFSITPLAVNTAVGAALVQVTLNKDKWEAVEVLLSHYLSPVLCDHIYSSRTNLVAGVPCPASAHAAKPGTQRLPSAIKELLQSSTEFSMETAPLFVHRHKVVLHKFPTRSSPALVITAPPQNKFLAALKCLGLHQEGMFL